jgi:hypothetical protein
MAAIMEMMAITTKSSMRVKARRDADNGAVRLFEIVMKLLRENVM